MWRAERASRARRSTSRVFASAVVAAIDDVDHGDHDIDHADHDADHGDHDVDHVDHDADHNGADHADQGAENEDDDATTRAPLPHHLGRAAAQGHDQAPGWIASARHGTEWPTRAEGSYADIYDGSAWRSQSYFLAQPASLNLLLILNIDWFEVFARRPFPVGGIFLAVLNLERSIRYLPANVILAGLTSSESEPKSLNRLPPSRRRRLAAPRSSGFKRSAVWQTYRRASFVSTEHWSMDGDRVRGGNVHRQCH